MKTHLFIDRSTSDYRAYRVYLGDERDAVFVGLVHQLERDGRWLAGPDDQHGKRHGHASRADAVKCLLGRA